MDKVIKAVKITLAWLFVAFCLLMAIGCGGCGSVAGTVLFLITAVISMPLKMIGILWNKVLGISKIPEMPQEASAKWYQIKKGKEQNLRRNVLENRKRRKLLKPTIIALFFVFSFVISMGTIEGVSNTDTINEVTEVVSVGAFDGKIPDSSETPTSTKTAKSSVTSTKKAITTVQSDTATSETIKIPDETPEIVTTISSDEFDLSNIPAYSGNPYVEVNQNVPYFTENELSTTSYEYYSELDSFGRCGVCIASVGKDIMPTEERGEIGAIKPTGWHTVKYIGVIDGNYLYNRCHLIGYQLTGENANTRNLITGTRYMNVVGMAPFENMVADYVNETGNHVMYRVTPIFDGKNLLASGVLMEGKSVEDHGAGILFNVFCYNVQPGIVINYANGESSLDESAGVSTQGTENSEITEATQSSVVATATPQQEQQTSSATGTYAVNSKNGKIHIVGACPATGTGDGAMSAPVYFNSYEEAESYSITIAPNQSKRKCGNCY